MTDWKEEIRIRFWFIWNSSRINYIYHSLEALKKRFGIVEGITDKDYLTNSYHVNVKEHIDAFDKLQVEAKIPKSIFWRSNQLMLKSLICQKI